MKKAMNIFIKNNKLFLALMFFTLFFIYTDFADRYNFKILSIFFLIAMCALYGLFFSIDKKAISLNKTFCLFYFFFFSLAPVIQYKHSTTFYFEGFIDDKTYLHTSFTVLLSFLFYLILYNKITEYFVKFKFKKIRVLENNLLSHHLLFRCSCFLSILSILLYLYLIKFNWGLLVFRPYSFDLKNNTNLGLLGYSLLTIVKIIPFIIFINYVVLGNKYKTHTLFLFSLMLVTCFPTALPRGILAIIYLPILVVYFPFLKKNKYYISLYCFLILLIFPLFNVFRHIQKKGFVLEYELFNSGHFDAFHNFSLLLRERILTNGEQLLTSVLFFLPEKYWLNKPPGTGHLLAEVLEFNHLNIAMPLIGEGYANFGYIGILIFISIVVMINVFLENTRLNNNLIKIYFYIFLGYEFYLLRGDLWSSIKIFSSFSLAILMVFSCYILLGKLEKRKIKY